jgi:soluble lytic murein transglycosylase-like protein
MKPNIAGYLPEPSASKIRHEPQKNDDSPHKDDIDDIISNAAQRFNVDSDLIRGVIKAESNFNRNSTSPKGAMGLMQLMPETARDLGVKDPYDSYENIMGGTRYLKGLLDRYDGNVDRALAAYNWGMGNVERNPGKLPRETRTYISRIKEYYFDAKA